MSTRKSLFFSFLDRYASLAISVVSSMVIARLLTPAEIGIFSVTMVLLMLVSTVRDMGAGQYMVQEENLTTERIRAVWAVQLGLGLGLACLVLLASYPVSVFYKEPRMRDIMLVVALNYAINPFGSLTYAWLMREMRFESVALMRFLAGLTGALVATWMAWKSYGPISLAFGSLASTVVNALIAVYYRPKSFPWLPGVGEIRRVLMFGSKLTVSSIVKVIADGAPELLLGKLQDLTAAGLYSRSNGLVQMFHRLFVDAVGAVCLPWFARQSREQGSFVAPFLKATSYVTAFGWAFCLAVICLAQPIVRALYGNQWDQAVDLARLLAVAMAFSVPAALSGTALLSSGAATTIAKVTVMSAIQSVTFVALGASQGLMALGIAMIAAAAISAAIWLRATSRHIGLPLRALLRTLRQSAAVALLAAIGPVLAFWIYGPYPEVLVMPLVLGGVGGLAGFVAGVLVFQHPLREEIMTIWSRIKRQAV
ncbi:MAG: oligosaccharide flippase family protein [Polaromonas sp.]|nr:oligosaccharide flippase family protein [Polaromonas sp.]